MTAAMLCLTPHDPRRRPRARGGAYNRSPHNTLLLTPRRLTTRARGEPRRRQRVQLSASGFPAVKADTFPQHVLGESSYCEGELAHWHCL